MSDASCLRAPHRALRVGYVIKMYPRFSETFIVNEILELERQGAEVRIFSLVVPDEGRFHGGVAEVRAAVTYLPPPRHSESWQFLQRRMGERGGRWPGLQRAFSHALACGVPSSLKYLLQATTLVEKLGDVDHLHAHFASSPAHVAMYASLIAGVPFSFTAHAKDIYHDEYQGDLLADKIRQAAIAVTVADDNRAHLIRAYGPWVGARVVRVYNGIDLARFGTRKPAPGPPLVLAVGRLVEKKGFRHLIDAAALLRESRVPFRVAVVGDGEEREALARRIRELGLEAEVELLGARSQEQVIRLLRGASVMALPCVIGKDGNRDALPTVLLEALAARVPCVSTPVTGIPEILDHGRAGLLVPPGDAAALAGAIQRLLASPGLRRKLAARGRGRAEEHFDVHKNVGQIHALFRRSAGLAPLAAEPRPQTEEVPCRTDVPT